MAQITVGDIESEVIDRLNAAGRAVLADPSDPNSAALQAMTLAGLLWQAGLAEQVAGRMLPLVLHRFQPITILDPCCGSGIMFLAAAYHMPAWIVQGGLVQFYGMDIDRTCVDMARANVALYGLNGSYVRSALALSTADLAALPDPFRSAYQYAQEAAADGRQGDVEAVAAAVRREQTLFDLDQFLDGHRNGTAPKRAPKPSRPSPEPAEGELVEGEAVQPLLLDI